MDIFDELGSAALGSRLRRLTDTLTGQAAAVYPLYQQVPFEPRWFPVFYAAATAPGSPVGDIAGRIGQSHAAVSQVVKELTRQGLVQVRRGAADQRHSVVTLTEAGEALWPQLQQQTADVRQATEALLAETRHNLWLAIGEVEYALAQRPLASRVKAVRDGRLTAAVRVIDYAPDHQPDFKRLNVAWIEQYFRLEATDLKALDQPDSYILQPGGHIFLATYRGQVVGTCALLPMPDGGFELAKMAVDPAAQGLGIGYRLGQAAIEWARARQAPRLYLESNTRLAPALNLYRKLGFCKTVAGQPSPYERCDIQMELLLSN